MAPNPPSKPTKMVTPASLKPTKKITRSKSAAAMSENHPVEVILRLRDSCSALKINPDRHSLRVKTDSGYRDFSLDGVSLSEEEDLDAFYKKFVESRINGVKLGDTCTIMMYGPTGSGKSYTMFGSSKLSGIVYRALKDILGVDDEDESSVQVTVSVLEIYNEDIYDLLRTSKPKLQISKKKAQNASVIDGLDAVKISKEIQKVEKRRIVRSTRSNERSSRSHCMIILKVPTVGGRLMLVDMAGSENIEQAGQNGLEAKIQTTKINQGNIALRRVVESIANGDSHVPFRDSKLTMLLQDSFEEDESKILMILCASPDPKELHKTISTLEYGAKAKCIVRGPYTPIKEKGAEDPSCDVIFRRRMAAKDQRIRKLESENKQAQKLVQKKDEEISALKAKLALLERKGTEANEDILNPKANDRTMEASSSGIEKRTHDVVIEDLDVPFSNFATKSSLSTVYEEEEEDWNGDDNASKGLDEEVQKVGMPNPMTIKRPLEKNGASKENLIVGEEKDDIIVSVAWEASKEYPYGKFISIFTALKGSTLADLRERIEALHCSDTRTFSFLVPKDPSGADPSGAPVPREMEAITLASKLPTFRNQLNRYAWLRPADHLPSSPLDNKSSSQVQLTIAHSTKRYNYVTIPKGFADKNDLTENKNVELRNGAGDSWQAKLNVKYVKEKDRRRRRTQVRFTDLKVFLTENKLQPGDKCTFKLVDRPSRSSEDLVVDVAFERQRFKRQRL